MTQPKTLTITIPRNAIVHVLIGLAVAAVACLAFVLYAHMPPAGYPIRGVLLGLGVVGSCGALAYWLWCTLQCVKADNDTGHDATHETLETLLKEQRERADAERERAEAAAARESVILANIESLQAEQKKLTETVESLVDIVEVLRDCYLEEGRTQDRREQGSTPPREP